MSVTDALTLLGAIAALPFVPWRSPTLRRVLVATAGLLRHPRLITVVAHPAQRSTRRDGPPRLDRRRCRLHRRRRVARLGHAAAGAARVPLQRRRSSRWPSALDTLAHHLQPAYPFGIQKNAAGELIVMGLVILLTVPRARRLQPLHDRRRWRCTLVVGLAASESRGAGAGADRGVRPAPRASAPASGGSSSRSCAWLRLLLVVQRGVPRHQRRHLPGPRPQPDRPRSSTA